MVKLACGLQQQICHFNHDARAFFVHHPVHTAIELNACLQELCAVYINQVYAIPIPQCCQNFPIVHLEMLNILVAVLLWKQNWENQ